MNSNVQSIRIDERNSVLQNSHTTLVYRPLSHSISLSLPLPVSVIPRCDF